MRDRPTSADLPDPRPSACPGLLRIVQALDGGICRVKLAGGVLSSQQARAIAEAAERCASGVLELTNRSNLQIRGVLPGQQAELIERLLAAGLGPSNPAADDVRNLLLSPAAGLDPQALLDTRPLASALLDLLQTTPALHGLSAKFALQLDGGEALAMLEHPHDIWLSALPGTSTRLAFGLAGCPTDKPLGVVDVEQAVPLVEQLLRLFLDLAGSEHSRMRQLLSVIPAHQLLQQLQTRLPFTVQAPPTDWRRAPVSPRAPIGIYPQQQSGPVPGRRRLAAGSDRRRTTQRPGRSGRALRRCQPAPDALAGPAAAQYPRALGRQPAARTGRTRPADRCAGTT